MKTRNILIGAAAVLLASALAVFGWWRTANLLSTPTETAKQEGAQASGAVREKNNANDDPFLTEEGIIELALEAAKEQFRIEVGEGELSEDAKAYARQYAIDVYKKANEQLGRPLRVSEVTFNVSVQEVKKPIEKIHMAYYEGPQTVEALMAEFDENFSRVMIPKGSEIDKIFPREEWIQRALDLGVKFLDNYDYSGILQMRPYLARIRTQPEKYADLIQEHGLEDDANYNAFIDKEIMDAALDNILWRDARRKNPESTGGFRLGDRYIMTKGNQAYVKITPDDPSHSMIMYGPLDRDLTSEEMRLLRYHGIAPKGIEVFYIDENNEVMPPGSEPMRVDWNNKVAVMSEHERYVALQEAADFLNSEKVKEMTIIDWMTLADITGALLDYTEGGRTGVSTVPSGVVAPSEAPSVLVEQELPRLLPPGVELPESPGRSAEDVDAFFQFLDLHLIENADVPENVRRGLKQRYEAYQMWKDQDRLRRQEPKPPSPPSNEDGDTSDEDDEDE